MTDFDDSTMQRKIDEYLREGSNYAFELRCFQTLVSTDKCYAEVTHGGTYKDRMTGKAREYDIRGRFYPKADLNHQLYTAIECKRLSVEAPLIVHRSNRRKENAFLDQVVSDPSTQPSVSSGVAGYQIVRRQRTGMYYETNMPVAKSCERVSWRSNSGPKGSDSEIYDKWSQALSSAHDLVIEASREIPRHLKAHKCKVHNFIVPIVAIPDNTLWAINYNDDGSYNGQAEIIQEASYFVDHDYDLPEQNFNCSHLHFVTESNLENFIYGLLKDFYYMTV